jgi:hypothetical protein
MVTIERHPGVTTLVGRVVKAPCEDSQSSPWNQSVARSEVSATYLGSRPSRHDALCVLDEVGLSLGFGFFCFVASEAVPGLVPAKESWRTCGLGAATRDAPKSFSSTHLGSVVLRRSSGGTVPRLFASGVSVATAPFSGVEKLANV